MDHINDVINSVKATLYERISNPLLSSFLISWLIWNYKFVLVFFSSSMTTIGKIKYIQTTLFPLSWEPFLSLDNTWSIIFLLIGPLVTTGLYLYVIYPILGKRVYEDHKEHIREYENIKVNIEGKTSMSEEDVIALKSEHRAIRGVFSKQLDEKDNEIDLLKQDLEKVTTDAARSRNQLSSIQAENDNSDNALNELSEFKKLNKTQEEELRSLKIKKDELAEELMSLKNTNVSNEETTPANRDAKRTLDKNREYILKQISHNPSWTPISEAKSGLTIHRIRLEEVIASLVTNKYAERARDNYKRDVIKITPKGEKYLIDNNLI